MGRGRGRSERQLCAPAGCPQWRALWRAGVPCAHPVVTTSWVLRLHLCPTSRVVLRATATASCFTRFAEEGLHTTKHTRSEGQWVSFDTCAVGSIDTTYQDAEHPSPPKVPSKPIIQRPPNPQPDLSSDSFVFSRMLYERSTRPVAFCVHEWRLPPTHSVRHRQAVGLGVPSRFWQV